MKKTVKIPYKRIQNYILFKQVDYDFRKKSKKVTYGYDEYENNIIVKTSTHRKGKPAIIIYRDNHIGEVQYWLFGKLHRESGPAVIVYDGKEISNEKWYKKGKKMTDQDIIDEKKMIDRRKKMFKVIMRMREKIKN